MSPVNLKLNFHNLIKEPTHRVGLVIFFTLYSISQFKDSFKEKLARTQLKIKFGMPYQRLLLVGILEEVWHVPKQVLKLEESGKLS